jgi:hypothetical protein
MAAFGSWLYLNMERGHPLQLFKESTTPGTLHWTGLITKILSYLPITPCLNSTLHVYIIQL